ncbi:MAG: CDP-2,3-bis-(O-geranylgeranyl)-sn-glycerol synthase [Candidatus Aenigmarchaeota archaeon]|nr:CDP-2,3-bis-(O-geranylgeranyl)-sn-glycerol synthase [Candidatus Aenigmarchaeota archaeon]
MNLTVLSLLNAIWLILPAYAANGLAIFSNGRRPIDGGRSFMGKPALGEGKTWEGLVLGIAAAIIAGVLQQQLQPYLPRDIIMMTPALALALGAGAMAGDLAGSFIKRRLNIARGSPAPLLDQLDFLVVSVVFASFFIPIYLEWLIVLFVITPLIHLSSNFFAFKLGLKKQPY